MECRIQKGRRSRTMKAKSYQACRAVEPDEVFRQLMAIMPEAGCCRLCRIRCWDWAKAK